MPSVSLCGGKGVIRIERKRILLSDSNHSRTFQSTNFVRWKNSTYSQNTMEWHSSYFLAVPKKKFYHGMVIRLKELIPMKNGLFTAVYRNRTLLAVSKMLLYWKKFSAQKRQISLELIEGKNQILHFCPIQGASIFWGITVVLYLNAATLFPVFMTLKQVRSEKLLNCVNEG